MALAASLSDVRSALAIPSAAGPSTPGPPQPKGPRKSKPEGISRELYSLIGSTPPSLTPAPQIKPKLMKKPALGRVKTKWEWKSFTNSARKDGLQLNHWEKAGEEQSEYPYAIYNTTIPSYTYSLDEYTRLLEDPNWTKEETDYLFDLVKEYDMRWYVIHDRYDYPSGDSGAERGIDDLKARYYHVCKELIRTRPWAGDESSKTQLLSAYSFNKEKEIARKKYVSTLLSRTSAQIAEEEALYIEIKRLEQTERRFAKERDDLLRLLLGIDSGLASIQSDDDGITARGIVSTVGRGGTKSGRRRVDGIDVGFGAEGLLGGLGASPSQGLRKSTISKSNASDILHCIHRFDAPSHPPPGHSSTSTKTHTTPAYLRSTRLPAPPKHALTKPITSLLDELGSINYTHLVMPTRNNLSQLESLFEAATALVETKRAVDRVEQEIRVMKARKKMRDESEGRTMEDETKEEERGDGEKGMDVEEEPEKSASAPPAAAEKNEDAGGKETSRVDGEEEDDGETKAGEEDADADADVDAEADAEAEGEVEGEEDAEADGDQDDDDDDMDADADADADMDADGDGDEEDPDADADADVDGDPDFLEELRDDDDGEADADADGDGEAEEDGDGESVVGRKRRGMSTSSMDTSGTGMTRRSSKRNKTTH